VPVTLKDNIATAGDPMPLGTPPCRCTPAAADAPPAARLREAGAVMVAKTTMPDYGMLSSGLSSFHPLARNPWDLSKTPGGSSAGRGLRAAAGYGPLHLGTDIGGSLRLPAGWCGIFTLKPSLGRMPIDPPYTGRAAGPMTRTVADAALMMQVLSLPDARDSMSLPYQAIDWAGGCRCGQAARPAHRPAAGRRLRPAGGARSARRRRARRAPGEQAGAIVDADGAVHDARPCSTAWTISGACARMWTCRRCPRSARPRCCPTSAMGRQRCRHERRGRVPRQHQFT
jgi:Asp-tRNA(Asn)/Glu-tRNA(Gln) amidotransferase A subunit family amidase